MKVVHIVPDAIFIDSVISFFDEIANDNLFYCIVKNRQYELKLIKKKNRIILILENELLSVFDDKDNYDVVYFHSLPVNLYKYVIEIPNGKKVVWSSWGFDIYCSDGMFPQICNIDLYKPITKSYIYPNIRKSYIKIAKQILKKIILPVRCYSEKRQYNKKRKNAIDLQRQVLSRIDYCSTILDVEFDIIKRYPCFNAKILPSPYVDRIDNRSIAAMNSECMEYILLGNSADPSNNHLDLISLLNKRHIKDKIYVPLAYGDAKNREYLINILSDDENYIIQDNFMPRDEYMNVIRDAKVVVMGHLRQQALGNIINSLLYGHKVFLYEDSIAYKFFVSKGVYVFSIDKDLCQSEIDTPLEDYKIDYNRSFVLRNWDYDSRVEAFRKVLCEETINNK